MKTLKRSFAAKSGVNDYMNNGNYPNLVGVPMDYSNEKNWYSKNVSDKNRVDVFYLYPTAVDILCQDEIGEIDDTVKANAAIGCEKAVSCFKDYANIFVPFYRQMSFSTAFKIGYYAGFIDKIYNSVVRTDVYSALDYFFKHFNNGRPFVLAGLSQGGYCIQIILSEYMKLHPECYKRMIAAYCIGTSFSKSFLKLNNHIKMATGEKDVGVAIAWNTEAPNGHENNMLIENDSYCINPLNWKTDDSYAPASLNNGSYDISAHTVIPNIIDAQINLDRHVIVVTTASEHGYKTLSQELGAGDKSYHLHEWDFFYENVKENGKKRIDEFFKNIL